MTDHSLAPHAPLQASQNPSVKSPVPPKGTVTDAEVTVNGKKLAYRATADWTVLRKNEKPIAEIFFVHYTLKDGAPTSSPRPVTFVFNGGPGASSAYLHVGALGPRRVMFADDGSLLPPPARLTDNESTWLTFTDLVFVDPVGTGFSRTIDEQPEGKADGDAAKVSATGKEKENEEFYQLKRDLESLCEFISKFLSKFGLWSRPVFIAGESYGGFRVGKLARKLQEEYGVGLNGAVLISPALELGLLEGSDYDVLMWSDLFPSLVASAVHHGKSKAFAPRAPLESFLPEVERFATHDLIRLLALGHSMQEAERESLITRMADMLGLERDFVASKQGRLSHISFVRELLRNERKVCGLYDTSMTALDPFPDRDTFQGADPTLFAIERIFTGGINTQLRENLKIETDRDYHLLSLKVNMAWKVDTRQHAFESQVGATDDLRYAMALNPHMKVFITHGIYDLVTPYYSSNRLIGLMKLTAEQREQLTVRHFEGGHMFYAWQESRRNFKSAMEDFFRSALHGGCP